jgi:hypothetical protein
MRSRFLQNEHVMISMSCQGLNPNISTVLAASRLYTMTKSIKVVYQMEEECVRSERKMVDASKDKSVEKP